MNTPILPPLENTIPLSQEQIDSFRKDGHILVKGVLQTEEINAYREVINAAAYRHNTEKRALEVRDTYGKAFLQIMNLWAADKKVAQFTLAKRFAKIAANLLGVENVRIYHDQALYKEAGGGFTPWHQDQYYWPLDTNNTVTMWMPLMDINEAMGMLTFASGSHNAGFVENIEISDKSEAVLEKFIKDKGFKVTCANSMQAGDATWHYGWTLHSAGGNNTAVTREVMTVIYFADGAHVTAPQNKHQENDRNTWLGSIQPGQKAASANNPLIL